MFWSVFTGYLAVSSVWAQSSTVDTFIATESPIAKANLLANIGATGSRASGAYAGIVIASPSTVNPDYLYTWTRDSSLVFNTIIQQFTTGSDTTLRSHIDDFVAAQTIVQQISNPSGTVSTGGLGEPKFNIDETAFTGAWGRPQRDGPALRSSALITWANYLIANDNSSYVTSTLWPIIKLDLDYVAANWNQSTFDLWEEVDSSSFFTTAMQHRSMRLGAALATAVGDTTSASSYLDQAPNILCFQQSFWNTAGYVTANTGGGRSGIDANTVLTSIHSYDPTAGCDATTFQPCSDTALSNLIAYVDSFSTIYTINSGIATTTALATGRYPEDVYYNGNPWYLTTLAVAEQLYDALHVWDAQGGFNVTSTSLGFFQRFSSSITVGAYPSSTTTYSSVVSAVSDYADGFLEVVQKYVPSDGSLSEQYSKTDGTPLSATDLTWSYAAALTSFMARDGFEPASWGAAGLTLPSTCSSGGSSGTVPITFNVDATTVYGENIYIAGSVDALEDWSPDNALILSPANYPIWSITVNLPENTVVQYKYIRKYNGVITWESDPNLEISVGTSAASTSDTWR